MIPEQPTYQELKQRLATAEDIIAALKGQQVDAVIGDDAVALLKLHEVQAKLQRSEEWRALAVEAGEVGLWELDLDSRDLYASEKARLLLGLDKESSLNAARVWDRIHPADQPLVREAAGRALEAVGDGVFQIDFRIRHPDGRERWLAGRGRVICAAQDSGRQPWRIRGAILDLSEQKRIEQALQELNRTLEERVSQRTAEAERRSAQLQKLARELSRTEERERQHIAELLHDDLQQLLAAMGHRLELLGLARGKDADFQKHAHAMQQLLGEGIRQARSLSHELRPPPLGQKGLAEALEWLRRDVKEKYGLDVNLDVSDQIDPYSAVLPYVLFRSVKELLFNIIKHSEGSGARVSGRRENGWLVIRVEDDGRGADPDELTERIEKGAGLGLPAIEERLGLLGGGVAIDTAPGSGFRVTLRLPDEDSPA